jgi:hypothetical protein
MIRICTGTDPSLVRYIPNPDGVGDMQVPCDCGQSFDDVRCSVIYPHEDFTEQKAAARALVDSLPDDWYRQP